MDVTKEDGFLAAVYQTESREDLLVRRLHYLEDYPIVRRIGDRELYLGNWRAPDPAYHDRTFTYVLSLTASTYPLTTHHHPIPDGPDNEWMTHHHPLTDSRDNEWTAFEQAIDTARTLYRQGESLLIHCTAGISRSSTIIATTLAAEDDRLFHDALAIVKQARPIATPNPALHEWAVVYLAAQD